jgi:hypothetical protein
MSKTVVIHQPDFMPYLGFFHRFLYADLYVALDHVQFVRRTKGAWSHRDKIKTRDGESWLSLSVKKSPITAAIQDIELAPTDEWRSANLNKIRENYRKAPFFDAVFPALEAEYRSGLGGMADFNLSLIKLFCGWLGISIGCSRSSEMSPVGSSSDMIAGLVSQAGGTRYLSGVGARDYHKQEPFDRAGIEVIWQEFKHPVYPQQFGAFIPYLSIVDALFNCGPSGTAELLRSI